MQSIKDQLDKLREKDRRLKKWRKIVTALASVVVFCTVYALILPAITLESDTYCGKKEHKHSEECYTKELISTEEKLVCKLTEEEPHTHSDACYETRIIEIPIEETIEVPVEAPEVAPEPTSVEEEGTEGEETALEPQAEEAVPEPQTETITVTKIETKEEKVLVCERAETEGHAHGEGCYEEQEVYSDPKLSCTQEEHEHSKVCYANKNADVETEAQWKQTFANVTFTNDWVEDTIAIAESQLGYTESKDNYIVLENGVTNGYTRYGDWYGNKYGEWCAMFVSFCLNYAEVEDFPLEAGCQNWILKLKDLEAASVDEKGVVQYNAWQKATDDYIPERGNLIFFNWDSLADADHVGIVVDVTTNKDGKTTITTLEGNAAETVKYVEYGLHSQWIMGYGILPDQGYYCETAGHAHDSDCYNSAKDLTCGLEEHIHAAACKEEPEEPVIEISDVEEKETVKEKSVAVLLEECEDGKYYHSPEHKIYEQSTHKLAQTDVQTYILIPSEQYQEDWAPSVAKWSAKEAANYLVAYSAESTVPISETGANYTLSQKDELNRLSGMLAHAYPYLTYEEMKGELIKAYENGEIAMDVSACTTSEYIAAAQAAIWQVLEPSIQLDSLDEQCSAIKEWLLKQSLPEELKVKSYEYDVQMDEYDLHELTVDVTFNRPARSEEMVTLQLNAGGQMSEEALLPTGEDTVTIQLADLTKKELLDAMVSVKVSEERMQASYFANEEYQDMVSGQYVSHQSDLSFDVATEVTSVSVTKYWADGAPEEATEVEVKLFTDGEQVGEPVILSAENNWTYTWDALDKYDVLGNLIKYTIYETPMAGYYSTISDAADTEVAVEIPSAEQNYILTNTKLGEDVEFNDVSVTKEWAGRSDEMYPENVTVQLMQNDQMYDVPTMLNAENNWSAKWEQLPKTDNEGNAFVYTVEEVPVEGYEDAQETVVGEDGVCNIVLTNTWIPETVAIKLQKVDAGDTSKILSGAEFELYLATSASEELVPETDDIHGTLTSSVTVSDEGLQLSDLIVGETYYLVEKKAPDGYQTLLEPIGFTVEKREKQVSLVLTSGEKWAEVVAGEETVLLIKNSNGYLLPKVGGTGTTPYIMAGVLLMLSAICLMYKKEKRRPIKMISRNPE